MPHAVKDEEAAVQTNESELGRLFQAHHSLVFRTAYRITGNAADAEDVLQTVFLRLFRRGSEAQLDIANGESYLRRAAINASVDLIRERQAERKAFGLSTSRDALTASGGTSANVSGPYEQKQCLRLALAKLDRRSAEIFALRFFEDFSNRQIAGALRLSQVSVAVIIHRARRQLQTEIQSCLGGRV